MNLQELAENKKTKIVKRALKEHYEVNINFDKLSLPKTQQMLKKVKGLINETRSAAGAYNSHNDSSYLKLIMMEQALVDRLNDLRHYGGRVVIENEEVQKSQVILAAQDMIDTLQKMLEDISKMNVEELNAVVDGMKNEFGTQQGQQFGQEVGAALTTLQSAITAAKASLTGALGSVTGEGGMESGAPADSGAPAPDMGASPEMGVAPDMGGMDMEPGAGETPVEEPAEPEDVTGAGRERR